MTSPDPMAEIRASFFVECDELLEALQDGLTQIDSGDTDAETVNVCFRAVHSIKGGAGAFGLEDLVKFAHRYETVLDEVRGGRIAPEHDAILLFMRAADILQDIVRNSRDDVQSDPATVEPTLKELEALTGPLEEEEIDAADFQPMALAFDLDFDATSEGAVDGLPTFEIEFRPVRELFQSGNEPLHLIRALTALGTATIDCDVSAVPPLEDLDPEDACLGWTVRLETDRPENDIEETFDFVEGLCALTISNISDADVLLPTLPMLPPLPDPEDAIDETTNPEFPLPDLMPSRLTLVASETAEPTTASNSDSASDIPVSTAEAPLPPAAIRPTPPATPAAKPVAANATVRVDLERVERLVNLVGELVINQAMLSQSVTESGIPTNSPVAQGLEDFMQLTRDIQDSVMMIRAQPVKSLFQRMARIVRESSASLDKSVRLVTVGETTEVDKTVIERLADPLTHMIRNAVDHGLENADDRIAAGKPKDGCITLLAAHRSGRVIIEVSDDGPGIDRARVREIAETKELISPNQTLSDAEIDALLFLPGFSTAKQVSNLSGRGVGMDVVRNAIQDLGGRVAISSTPGTGTTFTISLPLTLAVLDGMVVGAADETLVVPLGAIVETLMLRKEDMRTLGPETQVLRIRDDFVPLLDLGAELGYREPLSDYNGSVVLLITTDDGVRAAMIVDTIHEQRQVVIKGLQDSYGHVPGIAAATILGDGRIALILDPVDLMTTAKGRTRIPHTCLDLAG